MKRQPMQELDPAGLAAEHSQATLQQLAERLATLLGQCRRRIVFAESCTGGLVAASLATVPGVSEWLCGSAVTYRDQTKAQWLDVPEMVLENLGAVSEVVARAMATGALRHTDQADLAWSITGHLGPGAPESLDGVVFVGAAERCGAAIVDRSARRFLLSSKSRTTRQREATQCVLQEAVHDLECALRRGGNEG